MKIILTEKQIKRIIYEQVKGSTKAEWPSCLQNFGEPELSSDQTYSTMAGTGKWNGYYFYMNNRYKDPNNNMGDYYCNGNVIVLEKLGDVTLNKASSVTEQDTNWEGLKNGTKVAKLGSRGFIVKSIQSYLYRALNINSGGPNCTKENYEGCDGKFGNTTKNAVIEYQKRSGIKADGIVGKQLTQIMFSKGSVPQSKTKEQYRPTNYEKYQQTKFYRGPGGGM